MSADLFAAFGATTTPITNPSTTTQEDTSRQTAPNSTSASEPVEDTWQAWPTAPSQSNRPGALAETSLWQTDESGTDVLFDAADDEFGDFEGKNDDDFGDFEDVETKQEPMTITHGQTQHKVLLDLLSLDEQGVPSPSVSQRAPEVVAPDPGFMRSEPNAASVDLVTNPVKHQEEDEWGDFEDFEVTSIHAEVAKPSAAVTKQKSTARQQGPEFDLLGLEDDSSKQRTTIASRSETKSQAETTPKAFVGVPTSVAITSSDEVADFDEAWDDFEDTPPIPSSITRTSTKPTVPQPSRERPTNVPPPAILLELLPTILTSLVANAKTSPSSAPLATTTALILRVSARIIAGRTLRWKRDTLLSQSMRIGAAGRSGGMKLTSLDKTETQREDQAAGDVVAAWTKSSHVLSALMVKAKVQKPSANLAIKMLAKQVGGADVLAANHPCPLCGLKRDERIAGVDSGVDDTFGEYWEEYWGHKDCCEFWYERKEMLSRRNAN